MTPRLSFSLFLFYFYTDFVQTIDDKSVSGVYDSFSEDTGEESLDMGQDSLEEEANKLEHVKRKILQDSTILSGSLALSNELEIHTKPLPSEEGSEQAPQIIVTDASIAQDDVFDEEEIPKSPSESEYFTAPSSRRHTTSQGSISGLISPDFNTTAEEMALYEMFGEDYDEIVAAMSHQVNN